MSEKKTDSLEKMNQEWAKERSRWQKRSEENTAKLIEAFTPRQIKFLTDEYPYKADAIEKIKFVNAFNKKNKKLKNDYPIVTISGVLALIERSKQQNENAS
jgi:IS30 family transposase